MTWREFQRAFPAFRLSKYELVELLADGHVAVCVGDRRVFTLSLDAEESDIRELENVRA